jgi:hypothetical protein
VTVAVGLACDDYNDDDVTVSVVEEDGGWWEAPVLPCDLYCANRCFRFKALLLLIENNELERLLVGERIVPVA